jgi:primosomal protein N''
MSDETSNLVLEMLRQQRGLLVAIQLDVHDIKLRLSSVETSVAMLHVDIANTNGRLDRCEERLGRIERRLDLVEVQS